MNSFDEQIYLDDKNGPDFTAQTSVDDDLHLARKLQEEYDREAASCLEEGVSEAASGRRDNDAVAFLSCSELSPVDSSLEYSDPNPDIRTLFLQFNVQYFWGALDGIEVKWSPRMTLCAGLCVYEGRGGLCSVRLSQPLLKLRPRKDLVETLLHEMIHAYLFITDNDRDHDGHGPQFKKHMNRINKATGASISIYHTFHDEVESYQQHWWRCNGPCQSRRPYFGYVKRAMNRAPSCRDPWWAEHQATCGGIYTKVKEPEGYGQKKNNKNKEVAAKQRESSKDIRSFMGKGFLLSSTSSASKADKGDTSVTNKHDQGSESIGKISSLVAGHPSDSIGINSKATRVIPINNSSNFNKTLNVMNGIFAKQGSKIESPLFSFPKDKKINGHAVNVINKISSSRSPHKKFSEDASLGKEKIFDKSTTGISSVWPEWDEEDDLSILDVQSGNSDISAGTIRSSMSSKRPNVTAHNVQKKTGDKKQFNKNLSASSKKRFVSVCEGGDFPSKKTTRKNDKKQAKYVFDELDSDEGLWNGSNSWKNLNGTKVENSDSQSNFVIRSVDVSSDTDGDQSKRGDYLPNTHMSDQVKDELMDFGQEFLPTYDRIELKNDPPTSNDYEAKQKGKFQGNSESATHSSSTKSYSKNISSLSNLSSVQTFKKESFTGQGHILGNGESGTTFLSQIRQTFGKPVMKSSSPKIGRIQSSSSNKGLSESTNIFSESERKRKLGQAFGNDPIEKQSLSKRISSEGTYARHSGSSRHAADAVSHLEDNGNRSDSSVINEVPCPVCSSMVSSDSINNHLDTCLAAG